MEGGEADCLTGGLCRQCLSREREGAQTQSVVLTIAAVASGSDLQQAVGLSRSHCRLFCLSICLDTAVVLYFGAIGPYSSVDRAVVS